MLKKKSSHGGVRAGGSGSGAGGTERLSRTALLGQLSSDTSMVSLDHKVKFRKPIKVRNVGGLDRRILIAERIFLLMLSSVGFLVHCLWASEVARFEGTPAVVDAALVPFAVGNAALLQAGLIVMLATKKFMDPRIWAMLDALSAMTYVAYVSVTSTQLPATRNIVTLTLSILAGILHTAMIVQDAMAFRRLHYAVKLASRPETAVSADSSLSAESLQALPDAHPRPLTPTSAPAASDSTQLPPAPPAPPTPPRPHSPQPMPPLQPSPSSPDTSHQQLPSLQTRLIPPPPRRLRVASTPAASVSVTTGSLIEPAEETQQLTQLETTSRSQLPGAMMDVWNVASNVRLYPQDDRVHGRKTSWSSP